MADVAFGETIKKVMEVLFKVIERHIGYLVGYKRYVKNLEAEAKRLEDVKHRIEGMVDEARRNMEAIDRGVEQWVEEVLQKQEEVRELLEGRERVGCLSIGSRYRLGRRGCKKKEDVIGLKQRGDDFVERGSVGRPVPLTNIWYTHATDYERFGSRDSVFKEILEALRDQNGSYTIGIHGLPGVGKTRIADEVAKEAKDVEKIFEEVARATVSQTPDIEKIQDELAECLDLKLDKDAGRSTRAGKLRPRLKNGKRILVVLDDVWEEINLMEIGIPHDTEGCKVLLTSREERLCGGMGIPISFRVEGLSSDEAWMLFRKKVGLSTDYQPEILAVAEEVCRECGGLPLVILVLGGALFKQRDRYVWEDTLDQLRGFRGHDIRGMNAKVYQSIELSFKFLHSERRDDSDLTEAQSCLLHCCLFPEDAQISIDDLVSYGLGTRFLRHVKTVREARGRVHNLVDELKKSSLLLEGRDENFVKMHDVIRDVLISIASKQKQNAFLVETGVRLWPDKEEYYYCRTISLRSIVVRELPDELECPKLHTLVLTHNADGCLKVPNNFFKGTEKLEVLELCNLHIWSLQNLVNLRMLRLSICTLSSLNFFNELHKLEILCLQYCIIEESPSPSTDIVELAIEAGKLTCLRILDFRWSKG